MKILKNLKLLGHSWVSFRHQHSIFKANIKRIRLDNDFKKTHIPSRCMTFGNLSGTEQDFKMTFSKAYWKVRVLIFKGKFRYSNIDLLKFHSFGSKYHKIFLHIEVFVWQYLHWENNLLNYGIRLEPIFCKM